MIIRITYPNLLLLLSPQELSMNLWKLVGTNAMSLDRIHGLCIWYKSRATSPQVSLLRTICCSICCNLTLGVDIDNQLTGHVLPARFLTLWYSMAQIHNLLVVFFHRRIRFLSLRRRRLLLRLRLFTLCLFLRLLLRRRLRRRLRYRPLRTP